MIFKENDIAFFSYRQEVSDGEFIYRSRLHKPSGVFFSMVLDQNKEFRFFSVGYIGKDSELQETKSFEGDTQPSFFDAVRYFEMLVAERTPPPKKDTPFVGYFMYSKTGKCYITGITDKDIVLTKDEVAKVFSPPKSKPFGRLNMTVLDDPKFDVVSGKFALNFDEEKSDEISTKKDKYFAYRMTPFETSDKDCSGGNCDNTAPPPDVNDDDLNASDIEDEDLKGDNDDNDDNTDGKDDSQDSKDSGDADSGKDSDGDKGDDSSDGDSDSGDDSGDSGDGDSKDNGKGDSDSDSSDSKDKDKDDKGGDSNAGDGDDKGDNDGDGDGDSDSKDVDKDGDKDSKSDGKTDSKESKDKNSDTKKDGDQDSEKSDRDGKQDFDGKNSDSQANSNSDTDIDAKYDGTSDDTQGGSDSTDFTDSSSIKSSPKSVKDKLSDEFGVDDLVKRFKTPERMIKILESTFTDKEIKNTFYKAMGVEKSVSVPQFKKDLKTYADKIFN